MKGTLKFTLKSLPNYNNRMQDHRFYLKPNVVIEPLIDRWYAWSHLISPATAAMNVVGRHLKIINSYIQSPQIHKAAVKNPKMLGRALKKLF